MGQNGHANVLVMRKSKNTITVVKKSAHDQKSRSWRPPYAQSQLFEPNLGCLNRLLSVDRFLDSRCQSRLSSAWWRNIFKGSASSRTPHLRPVEFFITI